jgi:four helix bundle protein
MVQDFKQLQVWEKAKEYTVAIYKATGSFPISEQYNIVSQLRRASSSIPANIAEGCGKRTNKDFASFLHNAMGSIKECENFIILSKELGYLKEQEFNELNKQTQEIGKMLNSLIKKIQEN